MQLVLLGYGSGCVPWWHWSCWTWCNFVVLMWGVAGDRPSPYPQPLACLGDRGWKLKVEEYKTINPWLLACDRKWKYLDKLRYRAAAVYKSWSYGLHIKSSLLYKAFSAVPAPFSGCQGHYLMFLFCLFTLIKMAESIIVTSPSWKKLGKEGESWLGTRLLQVLVCFCSAGDKTHICSLGRVDRLTLSW